MKHMKSKLLFVVALLALMSVGLVSGASAQDVVDNIVDVLATDGRFDTAYDAVIAAGLADTLASDEATYTVFVPNNRAFTSLNASNPGAVDFLLGDPQGVLSDVLLYHVVPGELSAAQLATVDAVTTIDGQQLTVAVNDDGEVTINGARILTSDIPAKNGVIHIINQVLVPRTVATSLPAAAPTGGATGGATTGDDDAVELDTIMDVLEADGRFTSLINALQATGLAEDFDKPGDFTLFAPTDEAFERISGVGLTEDQLRAILEFHIVGDSLTRDQLATDDFVPTMFNGRPIIVNRTGPMIRNLSGASVDTFNMMASNGIIHAVDSLMSP